MMYDSILVGKSNLILDYDKCKMFCAWSKIYRWHDLLLYDSTHLRCSPNHKRRISVTMLNIDFVKKETLTTKLTRRILKYRIILNMSVNAHHTHSVFLSIFIHFFLLLYLFSIGYRNMYMMRYLTLFTAWFGR